MQAMAAAAVPSQSRNAAMGLIIKPDFLASIGYMAEGEGATMTVTG
jgi:hypothetical protein